MFDLTYEDLLDGGFSDDELDDMLINADMDKLGIELEGALCNVLNKHDETADEVVVRPVREHKADEYIVRAM
jgi:hypothetical protein